jgi:hypothetical protein
MIFIDAHLSEPLAQRIALDELREGYSIVPRFAGVVKLVDALDSKSSSPGRAMPVRPRPPAP